MIKTNLLQNSTSVGNFCVDSVLESSRTILYAAVLRFLSPINSSTQASFVRGLKTLLPIIIIAISQICLADRARTNINEISDLFAKEIEDKGKLEQMIEESKTQSLKGETGDSLNILGTTNSEVEKNANELNSISANDLENRGQFERAKEENNFYETLEIDYSSPQVIAHRKDIDLILDATDRLLARLLDGLKELDIDCKSVKGDKIIEPELYLDIKKETQEDTAYNQHLCEELRNRYNCRDTLTVKCIKTGQRYKEWQYRTIRFNGHMLHNQKIDWGYAVHWKKKRWGWIITPYHPARGIFGWPDQVDSCWRDNPAAIIADARVFIANHLHVAIEQIREDIGFPGRGVEGTNISPVGHRWRVVWDEYEFTYYYRDVYTVCEDWSEDWNEACNLQ